MKFNTKIADNCVQVRPAEIDDCDLLFEWVNSTESLANKLETSGRIPYDAHRHWYASRLSNTACAIFIITIEETPCGQVRFEDKGQGSEVDVFVSPKYRGRNVASVGLGRAMQRQTSLDGDTTFVAKVLRVNRASQRVFEKLGFKCTENCGEALIFRLRCSRDQTG